MRPPVWSPPVEPTPVEQTIVKRIRRAKLFVFLREHRHELFDAAFQEELGRLYAESRRGQPPVPPAQLALVTILQAYAGASDAEAVEALVFILERLKVLTEPAAACTLAAAEKLKSNFGPDTQLLLIFCGGNQSVSDVCGYLKNV